MNNILENNKIAESFPENSITTKLNSGKQLTIKSGIDPTTTNLHLGHLVGLMLLKDFIKQGHRVVFIIGDFTAQLGDGKERPMLSLNETKSNSEDLINFLTNFFNSDNFIIRRQLEWFEHISLEKLIGHFSKVSLPKLLRRGTTDEKLTQNIGMNLHEFIYPILMAIDSIETKPDIEVGSIEQKFNLEMCRELMEKEGIPPEDVIINKRLKGIDGSEKMSKSQNNFIGILENLDIQIAKVMKIPNHVIFEFLELLTDIPEQKIISLQKSNNWLEAKRLLIFNVLTLFHSKKDVQKTWKELIGNGMVNIKSVELDLKTIESQTIENLLLMKGFFSSKRELKRSLNSKQIFLNNKALEINSLTISLKAGDIIQIGRRILITII